MATRKAVESDGHGPHKRRKTSPSLESPESVTIQTASDLATLLAFEQGAEQLSRGRWLQFKTFLATVDDEQDAASNRNREILLQYLKLSASKQGEEETTVCSTSFQAWHYASGVGHAELLTIIPSTLATLLRVCSRWGTFGPSGRQLCRATIRKDNLLLVERCLTPTQNRPKQVIACLRLLTEVVSFDLGSLSGALHRQGSRAFKLAEGCLSTRLYRKNAKANLSGLREAAIRFMLANLRYQAISAKAEIVGQSHIAQHLFQGIEADSPEMVSTIIEYCQTYVIRDQKLSTSLRSRFLSHSTLLALLKLTRLAHRHTADDAYARVGTQAYELLTTECLKDSFGDTVVGPDEDIDNADGRVIEPHLRLDFEWTSQLDATRSDKSLIRKSVLAAFLQDLRPDNNLWERKLALSIFEKHSKTEPEYFTKKPQYFDPPKLTSTWIGHASFLLTVLRLPPPHVRLQILKERENFATAARICDSILPTPIQREVMERCLNQSSELVVHMATQIAIAALRRFERVFTATVTQDTLDEDQLSLLEAAFAKRLPRANVILGARRRYKSEKSMITSSLATLLEACYKTMPQLMAGERMDTTKLVASALQNLRNSTGHDLSYELAKRELDSLLEVAIRDYSTRWFFRPDASQLSPYTMLLETASQDLKHQPATERAIAIVKDKHIVQQDDTRAGVTALLASLSCGTNGQTARSVFEFLDKCFSYFEKAPIKYEGLISMFVDRLDLRRDKEVTAFSPITMVVHEQWPFVLKTNTPEEQAEIGRWISRLIEAMDDSGENRVILCSVRDELADVTEDAAIKASLLAAIPKDKPRVQRKPPIAVQSSVRTPQRSNSSTRTQTELKALEELKREMDTQLQAATEPADHPELARWQTKDLGEVIDDGHAAALLQCLSSEQASVRVQALTQMRQLRDRLEPLKLSQEKEYVTLGLCYWLVGLVVETVEQHDEDLADAPLPRIVPAFAARALAITRNPTHELFARINKFVDTHPWWAASKLPKQWVDQILWRAPDTPGRSWANMLWLIGMLRDGLRTPDDVALYYHANVFEPLLCRCLPGTTLIPTSTPVPVWLSVVDLLYAYASIGGGASTLVTRFGILAWIHMCLGDSGMELVVRMRLRCLARKLGEMVDDKAMEEWSNGCFKKQISALRDNRLADYF